LLPPWLAFRVGIIPEGFDIVVDAMAGWTRSSFCGETSCVEVSLVGDIVAMRDGKNPDQPHLTFTRAEWDFFRAEIIDGAFRLDLKST
jgi:hypothetical protein